METPAANGHVLRFGTFELDPASGELRKDGVKVRLSEQPFQILQLLLERPGTVVTRQEIRQRLWTPDTFVDFDVGLNSAIRKLREALGDSADCPRFVETLPRRGYRFIAPVQRPAGRPMATPASTDIGKALPRRSRWIAGGVILVVITIGTLVLAYERRWRDEPNLNSPVSKTAASGVPPGVRPDAYDVYLKGVLASGHLSVEGFRTGVEYFEKAVAIQPDFAAAYAALADAQVQFLFTGPLSPREVIPKAEAAARKAISLDDRLANAHTALATILQMFYWRWEEGDREFRRARDLGGGTDPSASVVSLIRMGRYDEAIDEAERACQQDPLSFAAQVNLGLAYRAAGDYDGAVAALRRAVDNTSSQPRGHFQLGITLVAMGRLREGTSELETAAAASRGRTSRFKAYLGYAYAVAGRRADAEAILTEMDSRAQHEYVSVYGKAMILDALGEKEAALAALDRACEDHAMEFAQATQYPPFKTIAQDPRYEAIMQRVGLPNVGSLPSVRTADRRR